MNPGVLYAALAFVMWGLYPLYFRVVASVPAHELVLQRSVWSFVFIVALLTVLRRWSWLTEIARAPRQLWTFVVSALLISGNWLLYIVAVNGGHVLEASLGYFINPLLNVALGVLVLREKLRRAQWAAVALAVLGVVWLTVVAGRLPWIALALAGLFAAYGLVRKTAKLGALEGLSLETFLLALFGLPLLLWWTFARHGVWTQGEPGQAGWLVLSGPLSALPLLFFAMAARRLPLATLGLVQYLSPTIQLLLGVWVFREPFSSSRLVGFGFIWAALALVSVDALRQSLRSSAATPTPAAPPPAPAPPR